MALTHFADDDTIAELERQARRIAELEAALAPLARLADSYGDSEPSARVVVSKGGAILSICDLRAARALLVNHK